MIYLTNYEFKVGLNRCYKYLINEKSIINFYIYKIKKYI